MTKGMVVHSDSVLEWVHKKLMEPMDWISFDTETTGLRPYHGDRPFAVIIGTPDETYYFNLTAYEDDCYPVLTLEECLPVFRDVFGRDDTIKIAFNLKFDMAMLAQWGIELRGEWYDPMVMERVLDSGLGKKGDFSLAGTGERYGHPKDDAVSNYITKHKLWDEEKLPHKLEPVRNLHYFKVPPEVMIPYGMTDGTILPDIREKQHAALKEQNEALPLAPAMSKLWQNEIRLLKTVARMEQRGVRVDIPYVEAAYAHEEGRYKGLVERWEKETGREFDNKTETFKDVFADEKPYITKKGHQSFEKFVLEDYDHPAAKTLIDIRKCKKKVEAFGSFIYYTTDDGIIHTQLHQHFPRTGRFSSSGPNLQNMEKNALDPDDPFPVRRAIIPREGMMFYMLDYKQMEYRLMLDYAKERTLIDMVLAGYDVHEATAERIGLDRAKAKNTNFAILYGAGIGKLAKMNGQEFHEAKILRNRYFDDLPGVERFIRQVKSTAKTRKFIYNWLGRRQFFDKDSYYRAPNALIQGGCADIVKVAMNKVDSYLQQKPTMVSMLLPIHDELVFEAPDCGAGINDIGFVAGIMGRAYPHKLLPMAVDIEYSKTNLLDKEAI
jgi:DNA polymerase-1